MTRTYVIAGHGALVVVSTSALALAQSLSLAMASADRLEAVIEQLTKTGLRAVPSFACVVEEGSSARLVLRGDATATYVSGDRSEVATANRAATWAEHLIEAPESLTVRLGDTDVILAGGRGGIEEVTDKPPTARVSDADAVVAGSASDAEGPTPSTTAVLQVPEAETLTSMEPPSDMDDDAFFPLPPGSLESEDEFDFSHMLEETHFRGVEAAAVRDGEEGDGAATEAVQYGAEDEAAATFEGSLVSSNSDWSPPPAHDGPGSAPPLLIDGVPPAQRRGEPSLPIPAGDHDGMTVGPNQLHAARAKIAEERAMVQAVTCPAGHFNPPRADICRTCRTPITERAVEVIVRPALGLLRFTDGLVAELDRPLLIGRRPDPATDGFSGEQPNLISIPDPDKALSRTHLAVRLQEWEVFVVDLGSVNHSYVQLPGQSRVQLRPREPFLIVPETTVALGDVTSFGFEVAEP